MERGFVIVTAHTRAGGPSVILMRGEPLTPETRGHDFARLLRECVVELGQGAIVSVDWGQGFRVRLLPLL